MTEFRTVLGASAAIAAVAALMLAAPAMSQGRGPIPIGPLYTDNCRTYAPAGWQVLDRNQAGTVFTVASPGREMIASYSGVAVGAGQVMGIYGQQFRTPERLGVWMASGLAGELMRLDGQVRRAGIYEAIPLAGPTRRGYVLVYRFPVPDRRGYGAMYRIAIGSGAEIRTVGIAGAVAATARCTSQVIPSNLPVYHAPDTGAGKGKASGDPGSKGDPFAGTYNAQLGTGWMHDPQTGKPYLIDASADWSDTGPEGSGVYVGKGTDRHKLAGGME
jgi:hypothetical protein